MKPVQQRMKSKSQSQKASAPVLKLRELVVGILCIAVLIIWPLFMVSRQIFITNLSMRESSLSDSLSLAGRELAALRLAGEKLSSTARIESIMRERRGLEYPAAGQIVVIRESSDLDEKTGLHFFAAIKKSLSHGGS
jgi:cell division protein FtsL